MLNKCVATVLIMVSHLLQKGPHLEEGVIVRVTFGCSLRVDIGVKVLADISNIYCCLKTGKILLIQVCVEQMCCYRFNNGFAPAPKGAAP